MRLFAPALAFVDLETTGTTAATDAITEIGIVRIEPDPADVAAPRVRVEHARQSRRAHPARNPGADRHHECDGPRCAAVLPRRRRGRRADRRRAVRRAQRPLRLRLPQARVRAPAAHVLRARPVHGATVAPAVSRTSRGTISTASSRGTGCAIDGRHRALGDARVLWTFVQALYRDLAPEAIEAAARRVLKTPSLPPQLAARCARRAARGAGRLSLLRPQRAAALHRQEHESARARRRALLLRLSLGDRPAPLERDPAHRIRGNGRRDRRAAARSGARQVDAARAQPRAAPKGRVRRARVAGGARAADVHSRRRRRAGGARRQVRTVHVEAPCARDAALARVASTRCAGRRWDSRSGWGPASHGR